MGLIKAVKNAVETVAADQWREYFYCDALSSEVLVAKGQKRTTDKNNKGVDNIISNGSAIAVNEGQCMIIVDQGEVVDFCAEAGEFVYDQSTEPSLLYGPLDENVKKTFSTLWNRFTFGGSTGKDQRIYFFNTKEIMNNLYGTATPIDFHLVSPKTGYELETVVKCRGEYTFKIVDPLLFYKNVCGNVTENYSKADGEGAKLLSMMKSELLGKLPMALAPIAAKGVLPYQLQGCAEEIVTYLQKELTEKWTNLRGIEVVSLTIQSSVPDEAKEAINNWNNTVMLANPGMREAKQAEAMADFMKNAQMGGSNGASPMDGMVSMMAMNMMSGMMGANNMAANAAPVNQTVQPAMAAPSQAPALGWTCSCGHADNRGKFCMECGSPKPSNAGWTCSCGTVNQGKFCTNCGSKKPAGAPMYKCDKCGWEPEDPAHPPKFCPECGDVFDDNDIK